MKALLVSVIRIALGLATLSVCLRADEAADKALETARSRVAEMGNGELSIVTRRLPVREAREGYERDGPVHYERLIVTWRPPGDWRLVFRQESQSVSRVHTLATYVFAKTGEEAAVLMSDSADGERMEWKIPAKIFFQEAGQRLRGLSSIPALPWIPGWSATRGAYPRGSTIMDRTSVVGDESVEGEECQRIDGGRDQTRISLWISKRTGALMRSREMSEPRMFGYSSSFDVTERIYTWRTEKGKSDSDFDLHGGWSIAQPGLASTSGWGTADDLRKWGSEIVALARENDSSRPGSSSASERKASSATKTTPTESQLLKPEQMAAIVLVEGEGGVGTGFVTKIRNLPFVVTNLHVIGGNEKLRVTTLTGAKVEVGAIHGAMGRDLAILRIEGEAPGSFLTLSADPLQTAKIGDKVVVVGNRRGGGVATQVSGVVQGVGPDKIEVDAQFQPGNSGSPIVHVESGEVIGLAAYSQTRKLDMLDGGPAKSATRGEANEPKMEQRWFGYRIDGVAGWQAIDLARWRQQVRRIEAFRNDSEALYYALMGNFGQTNQSPSVRSVVERFQQRFERAGSGQVQAAQDVVEYFRSLRALTENGKKELRDGDYYDYFRSSLYWETSITEQLRTREQIAKYLEQATENTSAFLSRLRN